VQTDWLSLALTICALLPLMQGTAKAAAQAGGTLIFENVAGRHTCALNKD
jgi:hypothetical protein